MYHKTNWNLNLTSFISYEMSFGKLITIVNSFGISPDVKKHGGFRRRLTKLEEPLLRASMFQTLRRGFRDFIENALTSVSPLLACLIFCCHVLSDDVSDRPTFSRICYGFSGLLPSSNKGFPDELRVHPGRGQPDSSQSLFVLSYNEEHWQRIVSLGKA